MSAMCDPDALLNDLDDDDGMPPLVDNPLPPMTFTFVTDMTPIVCGYNSPNVEYPVDNAAFSIYSPPGSPVLGATRSSHSKKRDASYIPPHPGQDRGQSQRSFENNRKMLEGSSQGREENLGAKAIVAQAEHRKKYPDWRFRPGSNALAKVKDGPKRRSNKKGRGEAEKEERSREKRCAKIADLLVAGKKGVDLAAAIEEYDCNTAVGSKVKEERLRAVGAKGWDVEAGVQQGVACDVQVAKGVISPQEGIPAEAVSIADARSLTPDAATDARFKVPLTTMFKRSSSAPASHTRCPVGDISKASPFHTLRRGSFSATPAPASATHHRYMASLNPPFEHEGEPRVGRALNDADMSCVSPLLPGLVEPVDFPHFGDGSIRQDDVCALSHLDMDCSSPLLPAFEHDAEGTLSPVQSPLSAPFTPTGNYDLGSPNDLPVFTALDESVGAPLQSSYSSLMGWAGDAFSKAEMPACSSVPPYVYGTDRVMKDAFDAAATAAYGHWDSEYGLGVVSSDHLPGHWDDPFSGLQHYLYGRQEQYLHDNYQFSDTLAVSLEVPMSCRALGFSLLDFEDSLSRPPVMAAMFHRSFHDSRIEVVCTCTNFLYDLPSCCELSSVNESHPILMLSVPAFYVKVLGPIRPLGYILSAQCGHQMIRSHAFCCRSQAPSPAVLSLRKVSCWTLAWTGVGNVARTSLTSTRSVLEAFYSAGAIVAPHVNQIMAASSSLFPVMRFSARR
ncbi:hypothetical protein A0H81_12069 [Grifola frondosa]|uniref:Uncharacterized protein n=1 Tax=Grifola frondosa TaxID=5627 RepID=A0A1C7LSQ4_GRIFR|nr:hypothetical protein A0H81_12069 [Grifola frondosa]